MVADPSLPGCRSGRLILVGYTVLLKSGLVISDLMLCGLIVWPTAVLLVVAAVGTVGVTAVVVGGISAIAWMMSDPG